MFKFTKRIFVSTLMFFGRLSNVNPLEYVSMNNQECKVRPEIVNANSNELFFILLVLKQVCVVVVVTILMMSIPDIVKNPNIKVFNLMSRSSMKQDI